MDRSVITVETSRSVDDDDHHHDGNKCLHWMLRNTHNTEQLMKFSSSTDSIENCVKNVSLFWVRHAKVRAEKSKNVAKSHPNSCILIMILFKFSSFTSANESLLFSKTSSLSSYKLFKCCTLSYIKMNVQL